MNKIFKVIWSKARNCYVVVSELAKSHDDGHVRRSRSGCCRKAAVLAAFALTTSLAAVPVWAADANGNITNDEASTMTGSNTIKNQSENSVIYGAGNTVDNSKNAVVVGKGNTGNTNSVVIGNGALSNAEGQIVIGRGKANGGAVGSIVIGNNETIANTSQSVLIGNDAKANGSGQGVIVMGNGAMADSNAAGYTDNGKYIPAGIVLGEYSYSNTRAGKDGYLSDRKGDKPSTAFTDEYWNAVWKATANPMAIGNADTDANGKGQGQNGHGVLTRQITGVAAGTDLTDAVNVAQLKAAVAQFSGGGSGTGGSGVHDYSVKSVKPDTDTNYNNKGATGDNALAAGVSASATGENAVAIGTGATAEGKGATVIGQYAKAKGDYATAFGGSNTDTTGEAVGNTADGANSVAFGERTSASGPNSTAFGWRTTATEKRATAFGERTTASGANSTAFGQLATASGQNSVAFGNEAVANNYGSTAFGNRTEALGEYSTAFGNSTVAAGMNTAAFGTDNVAGAVLDENGAYTNIIYKTNPNNGRVDKDTNGNPIELSREKMDARGNLAYLDGSGNTKSVTYTVSGGETHSYVLLQGEDGNTYIRDYRGNIRSATIGSDGKVTVGDKELTNVTLKKANSGANGYHILSNANATVWGENSIASGEASTAFGVGSTASGKNSLAVGGATASLDDSIALGKGSVTTRAKYSALTKDEEKNAYAKGASTGSAWEATDNAIAVGNDSEITRQITGVAAGSLDTDAVNVAQLKKMAAEGLDFQGNNDVTVHRDLGQKLTIQGEGKKADANYSGENLKVIGNTDGSLTIKMDKDIKGNSVTVGEKGEPGKNGVDGTIGVNGKDGSAVVINGRDGSIGLNGKDGANGLTIKGDKGKAGVDGTDGITRIIYEDKSQTKHEVATLDDGLKYAGNFGDGAAVKLNKTINIKGILKDGAKETDFVDGNIAVVAKKSQNGEDGELLIKMNKDLNLGNNGSVKMGNTTINNGGVTIQPSTGDATKSVSLTNKGLDNGGNRITNVVAGTNDTDAVNVSQLNDVKTLAGQHTTVEAGSKNITVKEGTNSTGGKNYTVDLAKDVAFGNSAKGDKTVAISGTNGTVTAGTGDNKVTVDGSKGQIVAGGDNGVKIGNIAEGDSSLTIYDKDGKATGKTDKAGKYVTNLDNKTWKDDGSYVSGRAATEDQLHQVESNVNKQIADVNTKIDKVDKHHTEVTVNGGTAAKADGSYTDGNLQIAQKTGSDGQKVYDLKLSDNLNIGGAGKDGKDGQNGHMGINGADGKSGIGIDGEDGISIKGKDGKDGVTIKGIDGKNGTEGHIGLTGSAGKDGQNASADIHVKNGQVGVDGTDGHGGKDGMDRVVYEDHNHVTHEVATMDDGMKYSGDSGNAAVKLNKNVQIYGGATEYADGNNIGVVASQDGDNAKLQVKLAKDLKGINSIEAKTITTGDTTMDNSGLTVKGDDNHKDITIHQGNVNMGGNKVSGVADGKVSKDSTDAVNGSQLWQRDQAINGLSGSVNKLGNRINRVGAGAAALAALHPLDFDPDDKWDFAAGYGNYRGANAAAVGAYYRPNEDTMFSIGGSFGGGENMVNAGVSIKLGQGNHVSTSRVAMAKEIKDLRQNVANLNAIVNRQSALIDKLTGTDAGMIKDKGNDLFPDVPANHWAYEYVTKLKHAGILTGYPDGNFDGDRMMTRYEFAAIVYRAIMAGAASNPALNQDGTLDKLANEFSSEMKYIRIDTIAKDKNGKPTIERVRVISDAK